MSDKSPLSLSVTSNLVRRLGALLLVVTLLAGCAGVIGALEKTPQRTREAFSDPIRQVHLFTQFSRLTTAASVAIGCTVFLAPTIVGMLLCPLAAVAYDYLMYEYILEPLSVDRVKQGEPSLVAPFWEGGPRADEGEFFSNCEMPTHYCIPPSKNVSTP